MSKGKYLGAGIDLGFKTKRKSYQERMSRMMLMCMLEQRKRKVFSRIEKVETDCKQ